MATQDWKISNLAAKFAGEIPDAEAVVFGDERITYAQLNAKIEAYAKALLAIGVQRGERVATLATCRPEYWISFLASARIGAIWLGLNPKYQLDELRYVVGDSGAKVILAIDEFEGRNYSENLNTLKSEFQSVEQLVALTGVIKNAESLGSFLARGDAVPDDDVRARIASVQDDDPALLVYTSGSTGKPKGALISQYGLTRGATVHAQVDRKERGASICSFPINHVACVADTCCNVLARGGKLVFHERFDPGLQLETIETERITAWGGVPTMIQMVLEHPRFEQTDLSSLEWIVWGGAALPVSIIQHLKTLGPKLRATYGMTETATNCIVTEEEADLDQLSGSIGKPLPEFPCRIMNDQGVECSIGEQGELQFKGRHLFVGYLNKAAATAESYTDDGWFCSGDLGVKRQDGTIKLVGRKSNMYKSGGYNVYPREIEILLEAHPKIELVAIVSVPDAKYQEVGVAYILPTQDARGSSSDLNNDSLLEYCKAHLANYKIPKHFVLMDELPILPVGKVNKVELKKQAVAAYATEHE